MNNTTFKIVFNNSTELNRKLSFFNKTKTKKKSKPVGIKKWYNNIIPLISYNICFLSLIKVTNHDTILGGGL